MYWWVGNQQARSFDFIFSEKLRMFKKTKVVLFSEINSKLGSPFLRVLSAHPMIELMAVVTSPPNVLCSYFINDKCTVNIENEAQALGVPVLRPEKVCSEESIAKLSALEPDYFIVANFQQILTAELLCIPKVIPINFHPSPLPSYAGLAPFYWIIRNGERQSAISVIKMDEGLDTGEIIMQRPIFLSGKETSIELRTYQEQQNVLMLIDLIPLLVSGTFSCVPQDASRRSYYGRPKTEDYILDFSLCAYEIEQHVRAAYRNPGAYFYQKDGTKVIVLSVAISSNPLGIVKPGEMKKIGEHIYISANDKWLELKTIEIDGQEVSASVLTFADMNNELKYSEVSLYDAVNS